MLWSSFEDIDIRDNARFYYMLLTNVAGAPLKRILEPHATLRSGGLSLMMTDNILTSSKFQPAEPLEQTAPVVSVVRVGPAVAVAEPAENSAAEIQRLGWSSPEGRLV